MRNPWPEELERCRHQMPGYETEPGERSGVFLLMFGGAELRIIANAAFSDSAWWEHVSISTPDRCPTWEEMCFVKNLFWEDEELVVQFHPPKSQYVNCHPRTLHLWRPTRHKDRMPFPPRDLV